MKFPNNGTELPDETEQQPSNPGYLKIYKGDWDSSKHLFKFHMAVQVTTIWSCPLIDTRLLHVFQFCEWWYIVQRNQE